MAGTGEEKEMEMDASFIRQQYGITPEGFFTLDGCPAFRSGDQVYIRIRTEEAPDEIQERYAMANWLISFGERHVPEFLPAKDGYYIIAYRGEPCLVLRIPLRNLGEIRDLGRELAGFHRRGRNFAGGKALNRYGLWKEMWERRLEQLDAVWKTMEGKAPGRGFERLFAEAFPYFSGLCENAMQYFTDTFYDERPWDCDLPAICHHRFGCSAWRGKSVWKNPFDWVVDHPSRDLAEWSRDAFFRFPGRYKEMISRLLREYASAVPLSPFFCRLYYSRLLLPLHFLECVEGCFTAESDGERLKKERELEVMVERSGEYEKFLAELIEYLQIRMQNRWLPRVDWLK
ncbi:MAG: spore coat protein YutH [Caldibacillus debilis]|nr:MAG: spore coat protein YutH [Caldibacillus debilis]